MAPPPRLDLRPGVTEPIVLLISRHEVESGDVASVVSRLKPLLATREGAWRYRGQMTLVVDGYDNDPRELVDIPQVREFLHELDQQWPYWVFFFNQVDDTIIIFLSCLCGGRYPGAGTVEIDLQRLSDALTRGFEAINSLFETHAFPEKELETISRGVIEVLEQAGVGVWSDPA